MVKPPLNVTICHGGGGIRIPHEFKVDNVSHESAQIDTYRCPIVRRGDERYGKPLVIAIDADFEMTRARRRLQLRSEAQTYDLPRLYRAQIVSLSFASQLQ